MIKAKLLELSQETLHCAPKSLNLVLSIADRKKNIVKFIMVLYTCYAA